MPRLRTQRFQRALLLLTYRFAVATGLYAARFDFERHRLRRATRLTQLYACCMNLLLVIPPTLYFQIDTLQFNSNNRLMSVTYKVNALLHMSTLTLTLLYRWRRERALLPILMQLLTLEGTYFTALLLTLPQQNEHEHLFYLKFISIWSQSLGALYTFYLLLSTASTPLSLRTLLFCTHSVLLMNVLQSVTLHYYLALWHARRRFALLNVQLQRIFDLATLGAQNQRRNRLALQLHNVTLRHYELTQLLQRLNECYKFEMMSMILSKIANNAVIAFNAIMLFSGRSNLQLNIIDWLISAVCYGLILLDAYLVDVACNDVVLEARHTSTILCRLTELQAMYSNLAYWSDVFAQQLCAYKAKINIAGMFDLNKMTSFILFGALIKNTLLLMQWNIEQEVTQHA